MDIRGHVGPTGDGNVGIRSRRWSLATWMRPSRKSVWQKERKSFWPDLQKEHLGEVGQELKAEKGGLTLGPGADKARKPVVDFVKSQQVTQSLQPWSPIPERCPG